jgi:two-component system, NtrC family, response regulator HydG
MGMHGTHADPKRILLIDDDPVFGMWARRVLDGAEFELTHALDPETGLRYLEAEPWDLLITDIEMPEMSGLELLRQVHLIEPALPVAVVTAHASLDRAVTALRESAADFLYKPIRPDEFRDKVITLAKGRVARTVVRETVLAVGAHPDDVEIAAAGTLLAHKAAGDTVAILTLSHGARGGAEALRVRESAVAAKVIGARLFIRDLEDTQIPEGNPTIGLIEEAIAELHPTVIYTHSLHDVHPDHRNTHRAVMVGARRVDRLYCFQSPSATVDFRPTFFVPIDDHVGGKLESIRAFTSQAAIRDYLESDLIIATARYWSRFTGCSHAEAFEGIRDRAAPYAASGPGNAAGAARGTVTARTVSRP